MDGVEHGGLHAAEAEIQPVIVQQRSGKLEGGRVAARRFALDRRPAREAESEDARHFVERLTSGVVQRGAE